MTAAQRSVCMDTRDESCSKRIAVSGLEASTSDKRQRRSGPEEQPISQYYPTTSVPLPTAGGWLEPCRYCKNWTGSGVLTCDGRDVAICRRCQTKLNSYLQSITLRKSIRNIHSSTLAHQTPSQQSACTAATSFPSTYSATSSGTVTPLATSAPCSISASPLQPPLRQPAWAAIVRQLDGLEGSSGNSAQTSGASTPEPAQDEAHQSNMSSLQRFHFLLSAELQQEMLSVLQLDNV